MCWMSHYAMLTTTTGPGQLTARRKSWNFLFQVWKPSHELEHRQGPNNFWVLFVWIPAVSKSVQIPSLFCTVGNLNSEWLPQGGNTGKWACTSSSLIKTRTGFCPLLASGKQHPQKFSISVVRAPSSVINGFISRFKVSVLVWRAESQLRQGWITAELSEKKADRQGDGARISYRTHLPEKCQAKECPFVFSKNARDEKMNSNG